MLHSSLLLFSFSVFNVLHVRSLSDFEVNEEAATPQQEVCFHSKPVLINLVTLGMNGMFSLLLHHSRSFLCSPIIHLFTQAVPNIRLFSLSLYIQRIFLFVISLEPLQQVRGTLPHIHACLGSAHFSQNHFQCGTMVTCAHTAQDSSSPRVIYLLFSTIQSAPVGRLSDNQRALPLVLLSVGGF